MGLGILGAMLLALLVYYITKDEPHCLTVCESGHNFAGSHLKAINEMVASLISRFKWEGSSSKFVWLLAELRAL